MLKAQANRPSVVSEVSDGVGSIDLNATMSALKNKKDSGTDKIVVAVRVRPMNDRERKEEKKKCVSCADILFDPHHTQPPARSLSHTHTHTPPCVCSPTGCPHGRQPHRPSWREARIHQEVRRAPTCCARCRRVMTKNNCAKMCFAVYILLTRLVCPCSHLSSRGAPQEPDGALDRQRGQVVLVRLLVLVRKAGGPQLHLTGMLVGWCFVATERARASTRRMPWLSLSSRASPASTERRRTPGRHPPVRAE
jgi:hypothetical protein